MIVVLARAGAPRKVHAVNLAGDGGQVQVDARVFHVEADATSMDSVDAKREACGGRGGQTGTLYCKLNFYYLKQGLSHSCFRR